MSDDFPCMKYNVEITQATYEQLKVSLFNLSKSKFRQFIEREESGELTRQQKVYFMICYIEEASKKLSRIAGIANE